MIERSDLERLARAAGLNTADVVAAWDAYEAARAAGTRSSAWQRANPEPARLLMLVHQQNEIEIQQRVRA